MKLLSQKWQHHMTRFSFIICLILIQSSVAKSQTISFNLLQAPCNVDGQLEFTVSGLTFPCSVDIYYSSGNTVSYTLNTSTDVILNYSGEPIYIYAYDGINYAWNNFSAPPFTYTVSASPAICPSLTGTASISITGGQSPFTVDWYDLNNPSLILASGMSANLPPSLYGVNITDANGCTFGSQYGTDSIYIWNQSGMSVSVSTTSANCTNGTASISSVTGGTSPYSYLWNNGATTSSISGLVAGSYIVDVTDANGCTEPGYGYVQQAVTITANPVTSPATCLQSDGSVITFGSGGMPPYTYQYSNNANTQSVSGLSAGNYSVTVTDANGCGGYGWFTIAASTPITANYSVTPSSCTAPTGGAALSVSGGTSPYTIEWSTYPVMQTGPNLTSVTAGVYAFGITDASGCVQNGAVNIPFINPIFASISSSNTLCNTSNGSASVNAWGGTPPFSYSWNTGSTSSSISGLAPGGYSCTISDAAGCSLPKSASVQSISPIGISFSSTPASCIFTADGSLTANIVGGQSPYTISWSNGGTTNSISGLLTGYYSIYVTDANGCSKYQTVFVSYNASNNSCYCTIEGVVYNDANSNCIQDGGENGIENIMISCSGNGYDFTDANGYYSFIVPTGTYTVSQIVQSIYPLSACQNNSNSVSVVAASNCTNTVDFGNSITPLHDIHIINTAYVPPVPGNPFYQYTIVSNDGTVSENGVQLSYKHDGQLGFSGSPSVSYTQLDPSNEPDWYSVQTGFPTLTAGASTTIINDYQTPTNIPLGTMLTIRDTVCYQNPISDWVNDYTPWNNIHQYNPIVVGSFDPNFKEVSPKGAEEEGYISRSVEYLNYVVHFQNTGTWPAQLVVIRDTLDADLDWETLQPGWSDHNYTASIDNNGVLTFRFENINLPDSASNPLGSMGMVSYSIKMKPSLPNLTEITNTAGIYFDYNAPVITNTTVNTITDSLSAVEELSNEIKAVIYPNPSHDNATLLIASESFEENVMILITDITGKLIAEKTLTLAIGNNYFPLQNSAYESGLYLVTIKSGDQSKTLRLVKN